MAQAVRARTDTGESGAVSRSTHAARCRADKSEVFHPVDPADPEREAKLRFQAAVAVLLVLLVGVVLGIALAIGDGRPPVVRAAGLALLTGAVAGLVAVFRWAGRARWRYDARPDEVRTSEAVLVGGVSVIVVAGLYEYAGPASFLIFALALVLLISLHARRVGVKKK